MDSNEKKHTDEIPGFTTVKYISAIVLAAIFAMLLTDWGRPWLLWTIVAVLDLVSLYVILKIVSLGKSREWLGRLIFLIIDMAFITIVAISLAKDL